MRAGTSATIRSTVIQNRQFALCHGLSIKWVEVGQLYGAMTQKAFVFASRCGSDSIQTLNRHNANINSQKYEGYTALLEVVGNQEIEAAKRLLANGANANVGMKSSGITPLGISASQGDERLTRLLLEYGAKIDS